MKHNKLCTELLRLLLFLFSEESTDVTFTDVKNKWLWNLAFYSDKITYTDNHIIQSTRQMYKLYKN
jgi:predicted membrane protein